MLIDDDAVGAVDARGGGELLRRQHADSDQYDFGGVLGAVLALHAANAAAGFSQRLHPGVAHDADAVAGVLGLEERRDRLAHDPAISRAAISSTVTSSPSSRQVAATSRPM